MPGPVSSTQGVNNSTCLKDTTPPPTPQVRQAVAFERAADNAEFFDNGHTNTRATVPARDPLYLELGNVEVGTRIQLVNLSRDPEGTFKENVITLELTGRDVRNRQGAVYLNDEQMKALDLQPGDMISLRAADEAGNVSAPVTTEILGTEWAHGRVRENGDSANLTPGGRFAMLDGEGVRKNVIARIVNDSRAPQVLEKNIRFVTWTPEQKQLATVLSAEWVNIRKLFEGTPGALNLDQVKQAAERTELSADARAALKKLAEDPKLFRDMEAAGGNGHADDAIAKNDFDHIASQAVAMMMPRAMEPGAQVSVQNQRTGSTVNGTVDGNGALLLNLADLVDGDPLIVYSRDNNGVQGKDLELVYSSRCKDGKAPSLKGGIGARLGGVI